jgi:hypothetical protein
LLHAAIVPVNRVRRKDSALSYPSPFRRVAGAAALLAVAVLMPNAANAQVKLQVRYTASLAGIPLGTGTWDIDVAEDRYTAVGTGRTTGLVSLISKGFGFGGAQGAIVGNQLVPTSYTATVTSDRRMDEVRMALRSGVVKQVTAEPPLEPGPDRVPVTDAHRKGVIDPLTAALVAVAGTGETVTPEACKRKASIFDGRQRLDLEFAFKRMETVRADKGYAGPVVVCSVMYKPIAGHRPDRPAVKYLIENRDMEIWFAPMAGTRVLVPFRFSVPTPYGNGVLQANHFVTVTQHAARPQPAAAVKTQ